MSGIVCYFCQTLVADYYNLLVFLRSNVLIKVACAKKSLWLQVHQTNPDVLVYQLNIHI
jgi:hypothetical protein